MCQVKSRSSGSAKVWIILVVALVLGACLGSFLLAPLQRSAARHLGLSTVTDLAHSPSPATEAQRRLATVAEWEVVDLDSAFSMHVVWLEPRDEGDDLAVSVGMKSKLGLGPIDFAWSERNYKVTAVNVSVGGAVPVTILRE